MKLLNKKENKIKIIAKIEENLANALRRYASQIPVLAIDEVEISKNDSPLYDETVAHRIGLVPLKKGKGAEAKLKLQAKGEGMVYSKEIKGGAEVVYENIPITFLKKGEELNLTAIARQGKGSEHSKFSPGIIFYNELAEIKLEKDAPKEIADKCPKKVFEISDGKVVVKNPENCDMCDVCVEFCKKQGRKCVEISPTDELIITAESFGQVDTKEILKKSGELLKKDLAELSKKISK